jgi:hypothetical protein
MCAPTTAISRRRQATIHNEQASADTTATTCGGCIGWTYPPHHSRLEMRQRHEHCETCHVTQAHCVGNRTFLSKRINIFQPPPVQTQPPPPPPPPASTTPPSPPTASCHGTDHFLWVSYSVYVGVPYIGPSDCDATYHALEDATWDVTNWQCVEKNGNIQLWFNLPGADAPDLNGILQSRYPSVAGGFNCPNH